MSQNFEPMREHLGLRVSALVEAQPRGVGLGAWLRGAGRVRPAAESGICCLRSGSSHRALVCTTVAAESEICPTVVTARCLLLLLRLAGAQQ